MDRTQAFHALYSLMHEKSKLNDRISAHIGAMKHAGFQDAALIKAVIDEMIQPPEVRANRMKNEIIKDAIFDEFFGDVS